MKKHIIFPIVFFPSIRFTRLPEAMFTSIHLSYVYTDSNAMGYGIAATHEKPTKT
jgi:hypothetical protein